MPLTPDQRAALQGLNQAAISKAAHLANLSSRRAHARNRHPSGWAQYQEYLADQRELCKTPS